MYVFDIYDFVVGKYVRQLKSAGMSTFGKRPENDIYDPELEYFVKAKDHRFYTSLVKFAIQEKVPVFIPGLYAPELLLSDLNYYGTDLRLICGLGGLTDVFYHRARSKVYNELADRGVKFIQQTIAGPDLQFELERQSDVFEVGRMIESSTFVYDPKYDDDSWYTNSDGSYALFFGNPYFGKGLDFFLDAARMLPDIKFVVASDMSEVNYDLELDELDNLEIIAGNKLDTACADIISGAKIVVLPYRISYSYGSSAVFVQACQARKPIVAPNIYPFSQVLSNYRLGATFEAENSKSLASVIEKTFHSSPAEYDFESYLKNVQDVSAIASIIRGLAG